MRHAQALKEKRGILQRQDTLTEQSNKVQTQLDVLTQQNSEAYARMISKYGTEDLDGSIQELEEWQAQLQGQIHGWQTELHRVAQEIKVGAATRSSPLRVGLTACNTVAI